MPAKQQVLMKELDSLHAKSYKEDGSKVAELKQAKQ